MEMKLMKVAYKMQNSLNQDEDEFDEKHLKPRISILIGISTVDNLEKLEINS
jgi:hypothetical protein